MWSLELHIEKTTTGQTDYHSLWHLVESIEIYSQLQQWQQIAKWKEEYNLNFYKGHYFICLSRISHGVNIYNEEQAIYAK